MVSIQNGRFRPIAFTQMVDITAPSCQIARQYMIRLFDEDFKDPVVLSRYATLSGLSPEAFQVRFQPFASHVLDA